MISGYREVWKGGRGEIVEKKSRFIATVSKVTSEEEASAFIEQTRKKYWDARHHCSAFLFGPEPRIARCSDDGEPGGTAGRPILEVILGEEIYNVIIVVTRYFGGTLLGTGGLVRAYTQAAQEGLRNSLIMEKKYGYRDILTMDYTDIGRVRHLLEAEDIIIEDTKYEERVTMGILVEEAGKCRVEKLLAEATNGRIGVQTGDPVCFAALEDGALYVEKRQVIQIC